MKQQKDSTCGVCATTQFEKNNYFYGKQFTVRDLLQEQSYLNEKRQLVNRMVLGWGVVCGLNVRWEKKERRFVVSEGMALDCCGHEIIVCEEKRFDFQDYDEQCRRAREKPGHEEKYVLCLEYDECRSEPVELSAAGCDEKSRTEYNRIREGYKLRLKKWAEACPKQPYGSVACLDRYKKKVTSGESEITNCETEKIHQYLCHSLAAGCPECEACDCVVLATIYVKSTPHSPGGYQPEQQPAYGQPQPTEHAQQPPGQQPGGYIQPGSEPGQEPIAVVVDVCTDRRFVYNNPLLYDLIYCHHGDLPHIVDFSWRRNTYEKREVDIETFRTMMRNGLTVYFDQEMSPESLNRHTFIVSYIFRHSGTGGFVAVRIPAGRIQTEKRGNCFTATFVALDIWRKHELDAPDSELLSGHPNVDPGIDIEITLRGSRIWSAEGNKALDGDYLADKLPTGNGTQGGDFVDWFRVMPPGAKKPSGESYDDY